MPTYNYKCGKCDHEFEEFLSISNRRIPEGKPCEKCGGFLVKKIEVASNIVAGVGETTKLMSDGWKDVMKGVKKANPRSNIKDY